MRADLDAFPEPLAVLDATLRLREANGAWRSAFGEAAVLAPQAEEAARAVLDGAQSRIEIDAAAGDGASPQRWTFLRCARSGGEPLIFVHARAQDGAAQRRREEELAEEDEERTAMLTERLLERIATRQVRSVVLDLSALEAMDTRTADRLVSIVRAISLLGARAAITGIQPAAAQTMTSLGIDLSSLVTTRTPKDAIRLFSSRS